MKTIELSSKLKNMSKMLGGRISEGFEPHIEEIQEALLNIRLDESTNSNLTVFHRILANKEAMAGLHMFASYIADHGIEKDIKQEELEQIQQEISNLIQTIENSMIDANLKRRLIASLDNLIQSIQEHEFFGILATHEIMQRTTGQIVLEPLQNELTEESKGIIRLFLEKMRDINTAIAFGKNLHEGLPTLIAVFTMLLDKWQNTPTLL